MKYQNIMLTIIAACLVILTLFVSGIIRSDILIKRQNTYDVWIQGVGNGFQKPLGNALPVTIEP
jgi:hypothetical protein